MAFWTSLSLVRPTRPPPLAQDQLGDVLGDLLATGLVSPDSRCDIRLKYGARIDADRRDTSVSEKIAPGMERLLPYPWDVDQSMDVQAAQALLRLSSRSIYRAGLSLGGAPSSVVSSLSREACSKNQAMSLDSVSFTCAPVCIGGLDDARHRRAGWIALSLEGYGYPYPWTSAEVFARATAQPLLGQAARTLARRFPVTARPGLIDRWTLRTMRGRMHPAGDDAPGWFWVITGT
ncbi:MAG TPA: hypothetical protein VEL07_08000 [Planctomycetota bacterium]|nr:hypothetical protein [Planctomycetota bacterium]